MITGRSYRQYCGIARALDLVGERWALLVVRELLLGPKRFTDLGRGLPGGEITTVSCFNRLLQLAYLVGQGACREVHIYVSLIAQLLQGRIQNNAREYGRPDHKERDRHNKYGRQRHEAVAPKTEESGAHYSFKGNQRH